MSEPLIVRVTRFATAAIAVVAGCVIGWSAVTLWPSQPGMAAAIGVLALACFGAALYALRAEITLPQSAERR